MATYTLVDRLTAAKQLELLRFDRPPQGYAEPGQFVIIGAPSHSPSYFAIASSPGEPLELLIKDQPGVAELLCALKPSESVEISEAQGPGFRAAETRPLPLICLVNGSAMSAVRPVIRAEIQRGLPRPVHLLYGVLSPAHLAFASELKVWQESGVRVEVVLDKPHEQAPYPSGFVQDRAEAMGLIRSGVAVVLCGVPPMIDDARARYAAVGHDPELVRLNF